MEKKKKKKRKFATRLVGNGEDLRRVRVVSENGPPCLSLIRAAKERKNSVGRGWHGNSLKNLLMSCSFRVCNLPGKNVS